MTLAILIAYLLPILALISGGWVLHRSRSKRSPDLVKAAPKTVYTFPPEQGTWTRDLPQRDETIGRDQYRPERLHGLIEFQKRTRTR